MSGTIGASVNHLSICACVMPTIFPSCSKVSGFLLMLASVSFIAGSQSAVIGSSCFMLSSEYLYEEEYFGESYEGHSYSHVEDFRFHIRKPPSWNGHL